MDVNKWIRSLAYRVVRCLVNTRDLEVKRAKLDKLESAFKRAYDYDPEVAATQIENARKRFQRRGEELIEKEL